MSAELTATGSNLSMSGGYNNYYSADKYHRLNTSSCYPIVGNAQAASDISALVRVREDSDSQAKMFMNWYMPEYYYDNSTWFTGTVRLFSPQTRDSARNYCQIQPYSSTYNNIANMIAHCFTNAYNSVLYLNGYQETRDTPTRAVEKVTADACSKLRSEHGSNLRVYLIEYRKQTQYKTFPSDEVKSHSYTTIRNCADLKYEVSSKESLASTLETIATNIKSFAGGVTAARNS